MRAMGVELVAHMGHSQMNIDSGMPTQFISVTYDGGQKLKESCLFLELIYQLLSLGRGGKKKDLDEEEAQEIFLDAVGRFSSKETKLGLVGSIQHLHLLPKYKEMLERAGFSRNTNRGDRLTFPGQVLGCNYST